MFKKQLLKLRSLLILGQEKLSPKQFIFLSSVLVGITAAFAVILLKAFAHSVFSFATYINGMLRLGFINSILPVIGILLTVLVVRKVLGGKIEKGTSQILYAVARKGSIIPQKQMYAQVITSSLTVGLGGSAGLESPIVVTGAAFGSNYAQQFGLSYQDRTLLIGCGVAAGIAAAFSELMSPPAETVDESDTMETVMLKFESTGKAYLPVLKKGKYYGFIAKSDALEAYRNKLRAMAFE